MKSIPRIVLASSLLSALASADVRLPALFGDHMVLQSEDRVALWGWASPGEVIDIHGSWSEEHARTTADATGRFTAELATGAAGGPYTLTFRGENLVVLNDVLLGEVWVCGGQSNMEWPLGACGELYAEEIATADHATLRYFDVARHVATTPAEDVVGRWRVCTPSAACEFSAVGYFYARALQTELGVPVGLVSCNWGGTVAEAWTSADGLAAFDAFDSGLELLRRCAADPESVDAERRAALAAWWAGLAERDAGTRAGWQAADLDDSDWASMQVPGDWSDTPLASFDGIAWMRRTFVAPEGWEGAEAWLELGPIDDMDTTWVNGVRVGGMEDAGVWNTPRRYEVPAGVLRAGENVIAVRVLDTGGGGGLHGEATQLSIAPTDVDRALGLAGPWRYRASAPRSDLAPWPQSSTLHPNLPTILSNGMLDPVTRMTVRGAIWYQGESNVGDPALYERLFPALIADWRERFRQPELPFYFVQLAPFAYYGDTGNAAALRDAQRKTLDVPHTGMAVTLDIGDPRNIHPTNKHDVGRRLALWALTKTYGRDVGPYSGPLYRGHEIEGDALRVHFDHAEGLRSRDGEPLTCFELAGADGAYHPAEATIDGDTLLLRSAAVPAPTTVRFAWGAADEPNLENGAGLPASSFRGGE